MSSFHQVEPFDPLAADYVPSYETVVPQAIQSCRASFIRFEPLTEGVERAFFDVDSGREKEVVSCIKRHVPQGNVDEFIDREVRYGIQDSGAGADDTQKRDADRICAFSDNVGIVVSSLA